MDVSVTVRCSLLIWLYVTLAASSLSDFEAFFYENGTCTNKKQRNFQTMGRSTFFLRIL